MTFYTTVDRLRFAAMSKSTKSSIYYVGSVVFTTGEAS